MPKVWIFDEFAVLSYGGAIMTDVVFLGLREHHRVIVGSRDICPDDDDNYAVFLRLIVKNWRSITVAVSVSRTLQVNLITQKTHQ